MFDGLSNSHIRRAIDELADCLGVREDIDGRDLVELLRKGDAQACVQKIASQLGLPVCVTLVRIPRAFQPGHAPRFQTNAPVRTDGTGRGREGIIAQIVVPGNLPSFGSPALNGWPIQVRVSDDCYDDPQSFVTIMAHELSHLLLASLHLADTSSELHAELLPLLLGFRNIVRQGRMTVRVMPNGTAIEIRYGYLTDPQFKFAFEYVGSILERRRRHKMRIARAGAHLRHKIVVAERALAALKNCLRCLDAHRPMTMGADDARRIVQFHSWEYTYAWYTTIKQARNTLDKAERFIKCLSHYTPTVVEQLERYARQFEASAERLSQVTTTMLRDARVIRQYLPLFHKLRCMLTCGYTHCAMP